MARSKTGIHYSAEDNRNGFLFALPWIIGFICFSIIPLATSFYYSFTSFNPVKDPVWVPRCRFSDHPEPDRCR